MKWKHQLLEDGGKEEEEVPDVASMSTWSCVSVSEGSTSESSFESVETSIEESQVQAEFAERTANEMKEWMNFWKSYMASSLRNLSQANLPKNSLTWEEDSTSVEETSQLLASHTKDESFETVYFETLSPMTPCAAVKRKRSQEMEMVGNDAFLPSVIPCTPCTPNTEENVTVMEDYEVDQYDALPQPRQIYSLLDYCATHSDETSIAASMLDSSSLSATVEDLHMEAREQQDLVDHVCRRTEWMKDCLVSLQEEASENHGDSSSFGDDDEDDDFGPLHHHIELPKLRIADRLYLCAARCAIYALDSTYIGFCSCLPLDYLQSWIWIFEQTSPRSRRCLLALLVIILAFILPKLLTFPLQPPCHNHHSAIASIPVFPPYSLHDIPFSDMLTEVPL